MYEHFSILDELKNIVLSKREREKETIPQTSNSLTAISFMLLSLSLFLSVLLLIRAVRFDIVQILLVLCTKCQAQPLFSSNRRDCFSHSHSLHVSMRQNVIFIQIHIMRSHVYIYVECFWITKQHQARTVSIQQPIKHVQQ